MNLPQRRPTETKSLEGQSKGEIVAYREEYEGLIPHPRLMEAWDRLVPGSAEQLFNRFHMQSDHRMDIESKVVRANNFKQYTGPIFAFIISMTTIIGGIVAALKGLPYLGGGLSFTGLAMLAGAFLVSTFYKPFSADRKQKKKTEEED